MCGPCVLKHCVSFYIGWWIGRRYGGLMFGAAFGNIVEAARFFRRPFCDVCVFGCICVLRSLIKMP